MTARSASKTCSVRPSGSCPGQSRAAERLADHDDVGRGRLISFRQVPTALERNAERREEIRRDEAHARSRRRQRIVDDAGSSDRPDTATVDHRQRGRVGGAGHARQSACGGENPRVEVLLDIGILVPGHRQRGPKRQDTTRSEARVDRLNAPERLHQQSRGDEQRDRAGDFGKNEDRAEAGQPSTCAGSNPQHLCIGSAAAAQRRRHAEPDRGDEREERREREDAQVDSRRAADRQGAGNQPGQQRHRSDGEDQSQGAAQEGDDQALGEQLPEDTGTPRPERDSNGHLLSSYQRLRQEQIGQVGARNQQETERGREHGEHECPRLRRDDVTERDHGNAETGVRRRIGARNLRADHIQIGPGGVDRRLRSQSRHDVE